MLQTKSIHHQIIQVFKKIYAVGQVTGVSWQFLFIGYGFFLWRKKMIAVTDLNSRRRLTMTDVYGLRFNDSPALLMMALVSQWSGWFSLLFQSISIYSCAHQSDNPGVDAKPSLPFCRSWLGGSGSPDAQWKEIRSPSCFTHAHCNNCY